MSKIPDKLPTPDQLYCNLMEEVNARLQLMEGVLNRKIPMHPMLAEELCYFQLRMLCETFASALLVAHGTLTGVNIEKIERAWSADAIFKEVRKLYEKTPHQPTELGTGSFYPIPYMINSVVNNNVNIERRDGIDFLTAPEFLQLYGYTHARVHRGALKDISKRAPYTNIDFSPIIRWATKFANLLVEGHLIQSPDRRQGWLVGLRNSPTGGPFLIAMGVRDPPLSQ